MCHIIYAQLVCGAAVRVIRTLDTPWTTNFSPKEGKNNLFSSKLNVSNGCRAARRPQSSEQSTMLLFILARSRNSLDSRWEGGTENITVEVTEERRDVSGKERDCRVKLPLAASAAHVPLLPSTWECTLEPSVGSDSDKHPKEAA